jgi:hypothetical protein
MKNIYWIPLVIVLALVCTYSSDSNKAKLDLITLASSPTFYPLYCNVDTNLISDCGTASVALATTGIPGVPGATPTPTATPAGGGTGNQQNTRFTVTSTLPCSTTSEYITLKFVYDTTQTQGNIDSQQGLNISGGLFGNTITGRVGTVKWLTQGVDVNPATTGAQRLSYLNVELNVTGEQTTGGTTTTALPRTCYTTDNVNCTALVTQTQCYTTDNKTCTSSSTTSGTTTTVKGTIKCSARNLLPN